jgi:hypothetical protein
MSNAFGNSVTRASSLTHLPGLFGARKDGLAGTDTISIPKISGCVLLSALGVQRL